MLKLFQIRSSLTINKHMIANSDISKTDTGADARPDCTGKRPDDGWNLACGRTREQRDPLLWRPVSSPCTHDPVIKQRTDTASVNQPDPVSSGTAHHHGASVSSLAADKRRELCNKRGKAEWYTAADAPWTRQQRNPEPPKWLCCARSARH